MKSKHKTFSTSLKIIILLGIIVVSAIIILVFGNPQWNRAIYIFQAYNFPGYPGGRIEHPQGYTGVWRNWWPNGNLMAETEYLNGRRHGKAIEWYGSGVKFQGGTCKDDLRDGKWTIWNRRGNMVSQGIYRAGNPWDGTFWGYDDITKEEYVRTYKDGKIIGSVPVKENLWGR